MGVPHIWLIDPIRRTGSLYNESGLRPVDNVFTVPGTPIRLELNDLFLKLDKKIAAHKRL
jgi:hypothetical protein